MNIFEGLITLVDDLINPSKTWSAFTQKMISIVVVALAALVGVHIYSDFKASTDKFIPVSEMMRVKRGKAEQVKQAMTLVHSRTPEIKSIWLFSWPDAINLDLVHMVGKGANPLPTATFHIEDSADVGKLGMDICTELNRSYKNTACTIFGDGDAWGLIVVVWDETMKLPRNYENLVDSLANRITHLLYYQS
jgi:hypothetical protein